MGLAQTCFTHPDFSVAQCWVHAIYLSPDTVKQMGPEIYCYVLFWRGQDTHLFSTPYNYILAIIGYANAAIPFVVTALPAL